MKRMLDQKTIDELKVLLSKISYSSGNIKVSSLVVEDVLFAGQINCDLEDFYDSAEETHLFPLTGNAGKVLAVNEDEDGLEAIEVSGGTKLYQHMIYDGDETNYILFFTTKPTEYTINENQFLVINAEHIIALYYYDDTDGILYSCTQINFELNGNDKLVAVPYFNGILQQVNSADFAEKSYEITPL